MSLLLTRLPTLPGQCYSDRLGNLDNLGKRKLLIKKYDHFPKILHSIITHVTFARKMCTGLGIKSQMIISMIYFKNTCWNCIRNK